MREPQGHWDTAALERWGPRGPPRAAWSQLAQRPRGRHQNTLECTEESRHMHPHMCTETDTQVHTGTQPGDGGEAEGCAVILKVHRLSGAWGQ